MLDFDLGEYERFEHSNHNEKYTVELVYYGHLGAAHKCLDYQGVLIFQVRLYDKAHFRPYISVWMMQVSDQVF